MKLFLHSIIFRIKSTVKQLAPVLLASIIVWACGTALVLATAHYVDSLPRHFSPVELSQIDK